jgi:hypothetical protein
MGLSQEVTIAISCGSIVGLIVIVSAVIYFTRKSPSSEGNSDSINFFFQNLFTIYRFKTYSRSRKYN